MLNSKKDTADNLIRKFNSIFNAIQSVSTYNYGVINTDIDRAVEEIEHIISAEECKIKRIKEIYDFKYI